MPTGQSDSVKKRNNPVAKLVSVVAFFVVPLLILLAVGAWVVDGQADELMVVAATGGLEQVLTDAEGPSEEELAALWLNSGGRATGLTVSDAELVQAFAAIEQSNAFEREYVASAARVGRAWNAGESLDWSLDLTAALTEVSSELPPDIAEAFAAAPVLELDWIANPGFDRLGNLAQWAALSAAAMLVLQYAVTQSLRSVSRSLWGLVPVSLLCLFGLDRVAGSSSPLAAALGEWASNQLTFPALVMLAVGFLAWILPRIRPRDMDSTSLLS